MPFQLVLETRPQADETAVLPGIMVTPPIDEDYWLFRVKVSAMQAVVGFPKFGTIGIGFALEKDWNTNLPYRCPPENIWAHIRHNKGDPAIPDDRCLEAIAMICAAAHKLRGTDPVKDAL